MISNLTVAILTFFFRTRAIKVSELQKYCDATLDPSFEGVVFNYMTPILYLNYIHRDNFTYLLAQERFVTNQLVFYFQSNHFLSERVSHMLDLFREAGLVDHLLLKYVDSESATAKLPEKVISELSFTQLSAVFGIWLIGLLLSTLTFLLEIVRNRI